MTPSQYRYVHEKLWTGFRSIAGFPGTIQHQYAAAWEELHLLNPEDFPDDLSPTWQEIEEASEFTGEGPERRLDASDEASRELYEKVGELLADLTMFDFEG